MVLQKSAWKAVWRKIIQFITLVVNALKANIHIGVHSIQYFWGTITEESIFYLKEIQKDNKNLFSARN